MMITLCASTTHYKKLHGIADSLKQRGYKVLLPSMVDYKHLEERALAKIQRGLILDHFGKIDRSDAIYVANYEKKGIPGYIGANVLMEISHALYKGIPVFLAFPLPDIEFHRDELLAMSPIVIGQDWDLLDKYFENHK